MLALFLGLAACASTICPDREPDGGIGGTGGCTNETLEQKAYAQIPETVGLGSDPVQVIELSAS
jgi:hypothetical protein